MSETEVSCASKNGSAKAGLTMIVGLFAIIAGIYSMIEPMGQRMDFLSTQLHDVQESISEDHKRQREDKAELAGMQASIKERFKEVETQFDGLREVISVRLDHAEEEETRIKKWRELHRERDARQWERIKALERAIYGQAPPAPGDDN